MERRASRLIKSEKERLERMTRFTGFKGFFEEHERDKIESGGIGRRV